MKKTIEQLIKSFEPKSMNRKQIFNDFLYHCFTTIDQVITLEKRKRKQDKYIIMRQNLINYLIVNERKVTPKLYK
tara:strand:- start:1201 stop:1425 length:225 start_codon:yes stop_codon:yes gene_type:complete